MGLAITKSIVVANVRTIAGSFADKLTTFTIKLSRVVA